MWYFRDRIRYFCNREKKNIEEEKWLDNDIKVFGLNVLESGDMMS